LDAILNVDRGTARACLTQECLSVPLDHDVATLSLATPEGQDGYLKAAFESRHPGLIADAVKNVAQAREAANIPTDESWAATFELFRSPANTAHLLAATAEAEAYLNATGQFVIEGPTSE
jgi:hypothetical protein